MNRILIEEQRERLRELRRAVDELQRASVTYCAAVMSSPEERLRVAQRFADAHATLARVRTAYGKAHHRLVMTIGADVRDSLERAAERDQAADAYLKRPAQKDPPVQTFGMKTAVGATWQMRRWC